MLALEQTGNASVRITVRVPNFGKRVCRKLRGLGCT